MIHFQMIHRSTANRVANWPAGQIVLCALCFHQSGSFSGSKCYLVLCIAYLNLACIADHFVLLTYCIDIKTGTQYFYYTLIRNYSKGAAFFSLQRKPFLSA